MCTSTFRFPVAVKHPTNIGDQEMNTFLEEVKSMLEISVYQENIVNLQGILYGKEDEEKRLPKVSCENIIGGLF